ncbi:MAG: hypothetical protein IM638_13405 [Bacteroidetes bacterium]|nr:hypothetical protein [Bacteroidota bacterium]
MLHRLVLCLLLLPMFGAAQINSVFNWEVQVGTVATLLAATDPDRDQAQQLNNVEEVRLSNAGFQPGFNAGIQLYQDDTRFSVAFSAFFSYHRQNIYYYRRSFEGNSTLELINENARWRSLWGNITLRARYTVDQAGRINISAGLCSSHGILNNNRNTFQTISTSSFLGNPVVTGSREVIFPLSRVSFGLCAGAEVKLNTTQNLPLKLGVLYLHGFRSISTDYFIRQSGLNISLLVGI